MIPVAANDVVFSIHAVLLTAITSFQVFIYDRGAQKVSKTCIVISIVVWVSAVVCVIDAWPKHSWLWLISVFNLIQVFMAAIKYIPQAIMNFERKSTEGWSVGKILLVLLGGLTNFAQLAVQSVDQGTLVNFYGNIGKTLLSLICRSMKQSSSLFYSLSSTVLYLPRDVKHLPEVDEETATVTTPLLTPNDAAQASNV